MSGVEDIYPLSPVQHGMLFHVLAGGGDLYFEQTVCTLHGALDLGHFRRAWQSAVDLHPALRTRFAWKSISHPVQLVQTEAALPIRCIDLRDLPAAEAESRARALVEQDPVTGFELERAPLMRLLVIRLADERHRLSCCCSHLIIDAWSLGLLLQQVFSTYRSLAAGLVPASHPAPAYRDYVRWQASGQQSRTSPFWRRYLHGIGSPTPLPPHDGNGEGVLSKRWRWSRAQSTALYAGLRDRGLTIGSFCQAAWALQLSKWSGRSEVLCGVVHSGRHPEVSGVDAMVGPLLNTLPAVFRIDPHTRLVDWLRELQFQQADMAPHAAASLVEVRRCSAIVQGSPLFESVVVVLNAVRLADVVGEGFVIDDIASSGRSNYPLLVRLYPGQALEIELLLRADCYSETFAASAMKAFDGVLRAMGADIDAPLWQALGAAEAGKPTLPRLSGALGAPLRVTPRSLLSMRPLIDRVHSPLLIEPRDEALEAAGWADGNRELLRSLLAEHGALLLRGFEVDSIESFQDVSRAVAAELIDYQERSTPRVKLQGKVYTSTEYPSSEPIALHNEFSYGVRWPMTIVFHCVTPADTGGETPIADCGEVLRALDPSLVERFERHGVMYVRNYGTGVDLPWQDAFQTQDRATVEAYCRDAGIDFEWRAQGRLRTRQVRQAVTTHPRLGTRLWFNQAHLFHVSNLRQSVRQGLLDGPEDELPRDARLGDGSRMDEADLREVQQAYRDAEILLDWKRGDIVILDNMRYAHGRHPFSGPRRIVVCMGDPRGATD